MAQYSSAAASTSASTSTAAKSDYDVFINHRGLDVKKTFASHLYRRLQNYGLRVFLDQPELQRGDYFAPQIEGAIGSASVHVAIFSSRYAESTWCLKELVLMLKSNSPIIPVFYHVKPDEIRWTRGGYGRALEELGKKRSTDPQTGKEKLRYDSKVIENWRNALSKAAGISGFELEACNGDEGELVDNVFEEVKKRVKKPALDVAKHPTGLDDKVADFENTVFLPRQLGGKPQILGIVGLGGVGKTTLAKELFNRKSSGYSRSCFLADVRDKADKGTLHLLQRELLKSLTGSDGPIINNVHQGKTILKMHISFPSILIILDDVDKVDQVDELLPGRNVLHSDSLILITSRSKDVLKRSGVEEESLYNLTGLSPEHSLELFCLYSFNQAHPLPEFESLAKKFIKACGGLPLSLKVFGALLNGTQDPSYWKAQLDKLQRILPEEIKQRLQISYEALDMEDRQIFLDIACFFTGQNRDKVIRICDGSGGNGLWGFRNLENKCLVEVNSKNQVRMHDHLRDMGREIAADPSLPRRLWRSTEKIDDLLQQPCRILNEVRGIRMTALCRRSRQYPFHGSGICMRNLQLLHTARGVLGKRILKKVQFPNLVWLRWDSCPYSSLPPFISLKNLRVLQVSGSKLKTLWKKESQAPLQLRELKIKAPLSSIPNSIAKLTQLERIVISSYQDFQANVTVTQLPKEFCFLQSLKALKLVGFSKLKSLPECFGELTNLRQIFLNQCCALKRLPECFGKLTNLQQISLWNCRAFERLPDSLGNLSNLRDMDLINCERLERLPDSLGGLTSLHNIRVADCSNLKSLPDSLGNLTSLHDINLSHCPALERLPDSFCKLIKLQHHDLFDCTNLSMSSETLGNVTKEIEVLPQQVVNLASLKNLDLEGTNLRELPSAIGLLHDLETLRVGPLRADALPRSLYSLKSLKELSLYQIKELKCLPASLGDLRNLKELRIADCEELECLPTSLVRLPLLTELSLEGCPLIRELSFKEKVKGKRKWSELESSIDHCILPRLQILDLSGTGISEVSFAEGPYFNLQTLIMDNCKSLVEVGTLPNTLVLLSLSGCHSLRKMDKIYGLANLQTLIMDNCKSLVEVGTLPNTLVVLSLSGSHSLRKMDKIYGLERLSTLEIRSCRELEELPCIETLISLRYLDTSRCVKLKGIWGLGQLTELRGLRVSKCSELEELEGIQHCTSLDYLIARGCQKLQWDAGVVEQLRQQMGSNFKYD